MTESVLPAAAELSVHDLFRAHGEVLAELRSRGVIRTRGVVGEVGEYLAAGMYTGSLAAPVNAGYDLVDQAGRQIQVKTRSFDGDLSSRRFNGLGDGGHDVVLFLVLDPTTFEPSLAREVTAARVDDLLLARPGGLRFPHIKDEGFNLLDRALEAYRSL